MDSQINHFQPQLKYGARGGFAFTGGITSSGTEGQLLLRRTTPGPISCWGSRKPWARIISTSIRALCARSQYGLYARDQWQVLSNLTVTLGVRYEDYPLAHRDHTGFNRYDPTTNLELIGGQGGVPFDTGMDVGHGIARSLAGASLIVSGQKTSSVAGYGITVDPNNFRTLRDAYPAVISQQLSGPNSYRPAGKSGYWVAQL